MRINCNVPRFKKLDKSVIKTNSVILCGPLCNETNFTERH